MTHIKKKKHLKKKCHSMSALERDLEILFHFLIFIEFVTILFLIMFLLFGYKACGGLSFLTRYRTLTPCIGRQSLKPLDRQGSPSVIFLKQKYS